MRVLSADEAFAMCNFVFEQAPALRARDFDAFMAAQKLHQCCAQFHQHLLEGGCVQ